MSGIHACISVDDRLVMKTSVTNTQIKQRLLQLLSEDISAAIDRERTSFEALTGPASRSLVLFGAGALGRRALVGLRSQGVEPIAFVDNNPKSWGKEIDGVTVYNPAEAVKRFPDAAYVVTIWGAATKPAFVNISAQLIELGVTNIIHFHFLSWKYPELFLPYYCIDLPHKILKRREHVLAAFDLLSDEDSWCEYISHIEWRLQMDFRILPGVKPNQDFPADLFAPIPDEVFVDCGAYDGDTIRGFLNFGSTFEGIVAFEADPFNYPKLVEYAKTLSESVQAKIQVLPFAVGFTNGPVSFTGLGNASSSIGQGNLTVECRRMDDLFNDIHPTFIKMDIEGGEMDALRGAETIIREARPILALSVYHTPDHLWEIPLFVNSLVQDYSFFLRSHSAEGFDTVLYCVPRERLT